MGRIPSGHAFVLAGATMDDAIYTGENGTWNVTRAIRDCRTGRHGLPIETDTAPAFFANHSIEFDQAKVDLFKTRPDILRIPLISIIYAGRGLLIDGIHRLRANFAQGIPTIEVYVIESEFEVQYRVTFDGYSTPQAAIDAASRAR